jgi:hypothetical protein
MAHRRPPLMRALQLHRGRGRYDDTTRCHWLTRRTVVAPKMYLVATREVNRASSRAGSKKAILL